MIVLQLSAGQGPAECCQAVAQALTTLEKECSQRGINVDVLQVVKGDVPNSFKSVLVQFVCSSVDNEKEIYEIARRWEGVMLWISPSTLRPNHKRKNWYISGRLFETKDLFLDHEIGFQTCRASGAGGQHVNTTDSAVRATHIETGLSVRVESERSQHANKKLARVLLFQKLEMLQQEQKNEQGQQQWQQHWQLERGNPVRVFRGLKFKS